ncbi:unnamed protein product [Polarella glacialis]|uniref:Uncharacterized protein n=1 Tax=Polarella glacialis TaxID=89957 RepID=A0A813FNE0_POLGL|nr:unnamed protein product [Polarella glacialis]
MFKLLNVSNPSNDKLVPLMAKIAAGLSTSIVVYGGLETAGNMNKVNFNLRCDAPRRDGFGQFLCGWPERLQQWLRVASGNTDSRVENRAVSGTTSSTFISGLSMILQQDLESPPDLIILDTLVNDASFGDPKPFEQDTYEMIKATFETFVRILHIFLPQVPVLILVTKCGRCGIYARAHYEVANYYHMPFVNYPDAGSGSREGARNFVWRPGGENHPGPETHQLIADAMAFVLCQAWRKYKAGASYKHIHNEVVNQPFPLITLSRPEVIGRYHVCLQPLSFYSARQNWSMQPQRLGGDWSLYDDRPGKPGWISLKKGSEMDFEVSFGEQPQIAITYLRSYNGTGAARIKLSGPGGQGGLDCKWDFHFLESYTLWLRRVQDNLASGFSNTGASSGMMSNVKPNSTLNLTVTNTGDVKVKLLKVVSC